MATDKDQKVIRISKVADDKLAEIAKKNHLSKSKAASRIISHYFASNVAVDLPTTEDFSRIKYTIKPRRKIFQDHWTHRENGGFY